MNFVAKLLGLVCLLICGTASAGTPTPVTVSATQVSSDAVITSNSLVVKFAVTGNAGTAPQAVALRVRFDESELIWTGVTDDPNDVAFATGVTYGSAQAIADLGATSVSASTQTDGTSDYRDVATVGSTVFPAANQTPTCFYVKFIVTSAGAAASTINVTADIISVTTNHFPFITLVPPAVGTLDANDGSDLQFVPANITSVEDWTLVDQ